MKKSRLITIALLAASFTVSGCSRDAGSSVAPSNTSSAPVSDTSASSAPASESVSSVVPASDSVSSIVPDSESSIDSASDSTSDSSVSSVVTKYSISADSTISGGTLTFSAAEAEEGEVITITVAADANHSFGSVSIDGIELTMVSEGVTYTFVMPAHDVVVKATFNVVSKMGEFFNGTSNEVVFSVNKGTELTAGESLTVTVTAQGYGSFYTYSGDFFLDINGVEYPTTISSDNKVATADIVIPEGEFEVVFFQKSVNHSTSGEHHVTVAGKDGARVIGVDDGVTCTGINFFILVDEDFHFVNLKQRIMDSSDEFVEFSGGYINKDNPRLLSVRLYSLSADMEYEIDGQREVAKNITYVNAEHILNPEILPQKAFAGDEINYVFNDYSGLKIEDGYYLENPCVSVTSVSTFVGISETSATFVVPDVDFTVTFNFKANKQITYTLPTGVSEVKIYDDNDYSKQNPVSSLKPGKTFKVYVTMEDGYLLKGITINGVALTQSSSWDGTVYYAGTMPDADATLVFDVGVSYTVTSTDPQVTFSRSSYAEGETVTFGLNLADRLHRLESISCQGHDDLVITLNEDHTSGSFVMPAYNVTLVPVFVEVDTIQVTLVGGDDENIESYDFSGRSSFNSINSRDTAHATSNSFISGEKISGSVYLKNNKKIASVKVNGVAMTVLYHNVSSTVSYSFNEIELPTTACNIEITLTDNETVTATEDIASGATVSYMVNGQAVDTLAGNLYKGDSLQVSVSGTASEGHVFQVKVTDSDGNVIAPDSYSKTYTITGNVTITVYEAAVYTITTNNPVSNVYVTFSGISYGTTSVSAGASFTINIGNYSSGAVNVTITMGSETIYNETVNAWANPSCPIDSVNGNIVITVTQA